MRFRALFSLAVLALAGSGFASEAARADDLQVADASGVASVASQPSIISSMEAVSIGYVTPTYGSATLGIPDMDALRSGAAGLTQASGFSSNFTARLNGASIGFFGGQLTGANALSSLAPAREWNFGASVGYGGFYLRGAVSDVPQISPLFRGQGWQAGFGYETGALDLRLTYATSQNGSAIAANVPDSQQQWTIGGIYQISSHLRLNADAFYGLRDGRAYFSLPVASQQAPQGTGARVGIQLRF